MNQLTFSCHSLTICLLRPFEVNFNCMNWFLCNKCEVQCMNCLHQSKLTAIIYSIGFAYLHECKVCMVWYYFSFEFCSWLIVCRWVLTIFHYPCKFLSLCIHLSAISPEYVVTYVAVVEYVCLMRHFLG